MKRICFVSLSRSDYTSLKPVIQAAINDKEIEPIVVAGGSHLLARFGKSLEQFEKDNIHVDHVVDFLDEGYDSDEDLTRCLSKAYSKFVDLFTSLDLDGVFILGDRWEMLAPTYVASFLRIPIFHHSGGDLTQGSMDNQTRYSISTQSHFHLVALEEHRQRLILMGEEEWRVSAVGEPALTEIKKLSFTEDELRQELGIDGDFVLATFHPTTFDNASFEDQVKLFLRSLEVISEDIVLTAPNPDPGSRMIYESISKYAKEKKNVFLFNNLGAQRYYSAMAYAKYMIGNSSSGIWEAPSFALPVVNIGDRQRDRFRGDNVLDVPLDIEMIKEGIHKASSMEFKRSLTMNNPYVFEDTLERIICIIKTEVPKEKALAKVLIDPVKRGPLS